MRENPASSDEMFIDNYVTNSKKRTEGYLKADKYIRAEEECGLSISLLEGLTGNVNWFKRKDVSLKNNPGYQKQWQARQNILVTEERLKEVYEQQFQRGDMNYWNRTIDGVKAKAQASTAEGSMYQRLQAYLSLAFYSISNQLIASHRDKEAQYFVDLYKMADATNSEAWYFSAILNARNDNAGSTESDLLKAVSNGFTDKNRMMQQPEFQIMKTRINFTAIENNMNKGQ